MTHSHKCVNERCIRMVIRDQFTHMREGMYCLQCAIIPSRTCEKDSFTHMREPDLRAYARTRPSRMCENQTFAHMREADLRACARTRPSRTCENQTFAHMRECYPFYAINLTHIINVFRNALCQTILAHALTMYINLHIHLNM